MNIFGRDEEIKILNCAYNSKSSEFLALYGRRRVGKTYLIREFFSNQKDSIFSNATGAKGAPMREQIAHFTTQLRLVRIIL